MMNDGCQKNLFINTDLRRVCYRASSASAQRTHTLPQHFPPQTPSTNTYKRLLYKHPPLLQTPLQHLLQTHPLQTLPQTPPPQLNNSINMSDHGSSPMFFSCFIGSIGLLANLLMWSLCSIWLSSDHGYGLTPPSCPLSRFFIHTTHGHTPTTTLFLNKHLETSQSTCLMSVSLRYTSPALVVSIELLANRHGLYKMPLFCLRRFY